MEVARIVLEYVQALVWPLVCLTAVLIFRRQLAMLLSTVERVRLPGGTQLDWRRELEAAEAVAEDIQQSAEQPQARAFTDGLAALCQKAAKFGLQSSPSDYDLTYYAQLAEMDPNLALAGLRMELGRRLTGMIVCAMPNSSRRSRWWRSAS